MNSAWERRLYIIDVLHFHRFVTYQFLAETCGVNKDTIRSDIAALGKIIPIRSIPGRNGGIYVPKKWVRGGKYLTPEQFELLENLVHILPDDKKIIMQQIIIGFSMPKFENE